MRQPYSSSRAVVRHNRHLELDLVTTVSEFHNLEQDWDALFEAAGRSSQFFQRFSWLRHWCEVFVNSAPTGNNQRLAIVLGRENGRLVMVWPLVQSRTAGVSTLTWMGSPVSQYGDVLLESHPDDGHWLSQGLAFIRAHLEGTR